MQVSKARDVGVNSIVLFPKVPDALKVLLLHKYFLILLFDLTNGFFSFRPLQEMKLTMKMV